MNNFLIINLVSLIISYYKGFCEIKQKGGKMGKNKLFNFLMIFFGLMFIVNTAKAENLSNDDKKILVKNLVNEAAELIETKGQAGVDAIADKNGKFNTKDAYVFVTSESGADLVNPAFKDIEGLPLEAYTNADAKAAQMTIVDAVKDKDTAWVEYLWPKPGETKPSKKVCYLKKIVVNGKVRIVGAGFYAEGDNTHSAGKKFQEIDTNKDGFITSDELQAHQELRFNELDKDKNEVIDREELKEDKNKVFEKTDTDNDTKISRQEACDRFNDYFNSMDANGDKRVSEDEFEEYWPINLKL